MLNKKTQGIAILFLTSALYGLYGIYARFISLQFDVFTQNWVRNLIVVILTIILFFLFKQRWKKIEKKDIPWIAGWVGCDILFVIALFVSFNNLPIGTALFLLYSGSTIAGYIAGIFFLKEKLTKRKWVAILLSFIGLLLIYGEQIQVTNAFLIILGFFTGIIGGFWFVIPKLISDKYSKLQLIIIDSVGILLVNFLLAHIYHQSAPPLAISIAWIGLLLYAITQIIGDLLIIHGFRLVEAHIGSLILPFEALFGVMFAFIFFKEILPPTTLIGGLLILSGAILPNISTYKK